MKLGTLAFASFAIAALAGSASAAPLNLSLRSAPDITAGLVSVSYNATTDSFTASGPAFTLELNGTGGPDHNITNGTFTIHATISATGAISAATLTVTGSVPAIGATTPLITANLNAFGFSNSPLTQIFEFRGPATGGALAGNYGGTVGVILNLGGGFAGNFNSNFSNGGFGVADIAPPVPAPATAGLLVAGALAARRRRR